ncbi:MAG: aminoacyl-tRNA hydrolase [Gammaproteobacteria bacterium]|nr:aminoacyl-tRNA hydrolase [Gammaproteobacteria bacterium]|tara:strand:- start:1154 stop:1747 length:594 start_codon:yes stop_codon:yes gene_type:complete
MLQDLKDKPKIQVIAGLGNPTPEYENTRHNAGYWFTDKLLQHYKLDLKVDNKLKCAFSSLEENGKKFFIVRPTTFINDSGKAISSFLKYYKIETDKLLVVHDEIDLPVSKVRLKLGGGHGGHNGVRDIINILGKDFWRLRIGINHPGSKDLVDKHVLSKPSKQEREEIESSIIPIIDSFHLIVDAEYEKFMQLMHTD